MADGTWQSCPNCGMNVSEDAAVCPNCGMPLDAAPVPDRTRVATGMTSAMDETATFVPSVPPAPSAPSVPSAPPVVDVSAPQPEPPHDDRRAHGPTHGHKKAIIITAIVVAVVIVIGAVGGFIWSRRQQSELTQARESCTAAVQELDDQYAEAQKEVDEAQQLEMLSADDVADEDTVKELKNAIDRYHKLSGDKSGLTCAADAHKDVLDYVTQQARSRADAQRKDAQAVSKAAEAVKASRKAQQKADAKAADEAAAEEKRKQEQQAAEDARKAQRKTDDQASTTSSARGGGEDIDGDWLSYPKDGKREYINARYGFGVQIPKDFAIVTPGPDNGDGQTFVDKDLDMRITVSAMHNALDTTPQQTLATYKREYDVSYSLIKGDVMVATWAQDGDVHYVREIIGDKAISMIELIYPETNHASCDPILEETAPTLTAPYAHGGADR
ncbi:zinc ribbon domain-containing protein [Bifidobacterium choerinum]|uniref:zinc ribbon domain-containing protein n=1 Tax=Bifidobacterium choerinum TaxID=35760 RepID=UPI0009DD599D|nr:zinc ribbon domain-containing protein [Bifidobacterium choerinum]